MPESGDSVKPVQDAVLDWKLALHNWRRDPSNENTRAVILTGDVVSGYALEMASQLERLKRESEKDPSA